MVLCISPGCRKPENPDDQLFCNGCGAELLLDGRFRVLRHLSGGGCGTTYEVHDDLKNLWVLKVLNLVDPKVIELFEQEARLLAKLTSVRDKERRSYRLELPQTKPKTAHPPCGGQVLSLEALFCSVDDFCQTFEPHWQQQLLADGQRHRQRPRRLCLSEILTILIAFHQSAYRNFKAFYTDMVCGYWRQAFPGLVSYQRFVEWIPPPYGGQALNPDSPVCLPETLFRLLYRHQLYRLDLSLGLSCASCPCSSSVCGYGSLGEDLCRLACPHRGVLWLQAASGRQRTRRIAQYDPHPWQYR